MVDREKYKVYLKRTTDTVLWDYKNKWKGELNKYWNIRFLKHTLQWVLQTWKEKNVTKNLNHKFENTDEMGRFPEKYNLKEMN